MDYLIISESIKEIIFLFDAPDITSSLRSLQQWLRVRFTNFTFALAQTLDGHVHIDLP
jgi:hypothetical protein